MRKLCLFFILAIASYEALGMSTRHKRQNDDFSIDDETLNAIRQILGQQLSNNWQQRLRTTTATTTTTTITTTPAPLTEEVTQSAEIRACVRTCGVTSEYNPVCGSNDKTYDNPSRLYCEQACGVGVSGVWCGDANPIVKESSASSNSSILWSMTAHILVCILFMFTL